MDKVSRIWFSLGLAAVLWTIMFSPWTAPHVDFWLMMSASACMLTVCASCFSSGWRERVEVSRTNIGLGLGIAALLWVFFWTGDKLSSWMFDFARPQVEMIYGMKDGYPSWLLSVLLLCLIGPAEEIFWRGYVQHTLSEYWNPNAGFIFTTACYTLVHAGSLNFMLLMAAMVAGVVWGTLYRLFPDRLAALIISHALWDAAVFVWFPI
ncbi:MAG: CPBP family intramembrane metalloprotease [Bacteroidales bacterium]|nr:CPBP family intramembrane metalloprotease [Bacteroidales bacterium]MCM1146414.1 CPBP family intramembrane metalloprotease [Bacteroidales bacterium]MCM1205148.1 CPBP family intramembrane metalloprotease [Bacillota bacterium]MCM1509395.1 CPBP family intramembrane metalloprotease [Clostridium sp.]